MTISDDLLETYGEKHLDKYTHWVYILRCSQDYRTFSDLQRKAESRLSRKPDWLREAFESNKLYYIGQTENLEKRLGQHLKKQNSSEFTSLFPPFRVVQLRPEHSRNAAERTERRLHKSWMEVDGQFVYSK